jgi:DNA-binding NarL/FixJ family response regulator
MEPKPTALVIDGQPIMRLGVRRLLEPDYDVDELPHGREATETLTSVGPFGVAVVEMRPAGGSDIPSGTTTVRALRTAQPTLGIVAYGSAMQRHAARNALEAGASAYVSKGSDPQALRAAVAAAAELESYVDPATDHNGGAITRRQREVLQLFANGLSTGDAAIHLGLSEETIRTHAKASLARLGARDRSHAVAIAIRGALID